MPAQELIEHPSGDVVFQNPHYFLRFTAARAFAITEVRPRSGQNLPLNVPALEPDFSTDGFFDFLYCRQGGATFGQAHPFMPTTKATVHRYRNPLGLGLEGPLVHLRTGEAGRARYVRTFSFFPRFYWGEVQVSWTDEAPPDVLALSFPVRIDAAVVLENSLREVIRWTAPSAERKERRTPFRTFRELERGEGAWLRVWGREEVVMVRFESPEDFLARGGLSGFIAANGSRKTGQATVVLEPRRFHPGEPFPNPFVFSYSVSFIGKHRSEDEMADFLAPAPAEADGAGE